MVASSMDAKKHAENSEQSDENKQLAASKLHNVRVSTNGARGRAPVGVRPRRCEARAALHTLTSVNQRLTPNGMEQPRSHGLLNEVVSFPLAHVLPAEPRAPGFPRLIGTGDSGNINV